jgi:hypothetical protein
MKKYRKLIKNNLFPGDCGLWYSILVWTGKGYTECVCPYNQCKTFTEAIIFYFKHYYKPWYNVLKISHHKYSKSYLDQLALCC